MSTERAQQLLDAIRELPRRERLRIVEIVVHDLAEEDRGQAPDVVVGLFADQPDLIEEVCEAAMQARENDPLRLVGG
jgi:hypothetical protein